MNKYVDMLEAKILTVEKGTCKYGRGDMGIDIDS